ncbi:MAG: glycosyltransferase family 4 protein [Phycisphaerales bacterium]
MRVCLVSREIAPFWGAGIGTYAAAILRAFAAEGHEVHALTPEHRNLHVLAPKLFPGVKFHPRRAMLGPSELKACVWPFQRHALETFRTLEALHERYSYHYVEFPEYWGEGYFVLRSKRRLGKFQGVAIGVRLHTPSIMCRELNQSPELTDEQATLEHMEASSIADADLLVSPSKSLLDKVASRMEPAKDQPAFVVPYPFSVKEFGTAAGGMRRPPPSHDDPAQRDATKTILYFGRLERRKGVETLVDSLRRLLDSAINVRCRLIGADTNSGPAGGSMLAHLKTRLHNYRPETFSFEPAVTREELGDPIRKADVVCLPSLWENFPNACLEAMSLRACVLASDAGGMSEVVEDGVSGVLFQGGNTTNLTATLRRVLSDAELRATCATNAPRRIATLCDPGKVLAATIAAVETARAGPRVADRFDPGKHGAALTIPVPTVRASDVDAKGGLMTRAMVSVLRGLRGGES